MQVGKVRVAEQAAHGCTIHARLPERVLVLGVADDQRYPRSPCRTGKWRLQLGANRCRRHSKLAQFLKYAHSETVIPHQDDTTTRARVSRFASHRMYSMGLSRSPWLPETLYPSRPLVAVSIPCVVMLMEVVRSFFLERDRCCVRALRGVQRVRGGAQSSIVAYASEVGFCVQPLAALLGTIFAGVVIVLPMIDVPWATPRWPAPWM